MTLLSVEAQAGESAGVALAAKQVVLQQAAEVALAYEQTLLARDEAVAFGNATVVQNYAAAAALTGLANGDSFLVPASDSGTHASVAGDVGASGGQTPNAGMYLYLSAIPGLVRVSPLESQLAQLYAQQAATSVGAVVQVIDFAIEPDDGVTEGAWYAQYFGPTTATYTTWRARLTRGSNGTADLLVNVNDVNVYGPRTIGASPDSASPSILVPSDSTVAFQIANITGSVMGVAAQLVGLPSS